MKSVTRAVEDEVWSQSLSRSSREIYADDRRKQREASRSWAPDTLALMAKRIKERDIVGHQYLSWEACCGRLSSGWGSEVSREIPAVAYIRCVIQIIMTVASLIL